MAKDDNNSGDKKTDNTKTVSTSTLKAMVDAQKQITKALNEAAKASGTTTDNFTDATDQMMRMSLGAGEASKKILGTRDATQGMAQAAKEASNMLAGAWSSITKQAKDLTKKGLGMAVMEESLRGFASTLNFTGNIFKAVTSLAGGLAEGVFEVTKSILAIPFKLLETMITMATSGAGSIELALAFENVRKEFGAFKQSAARDVIDTFHNMNKGLKGTGISAFSMLGYAHEALEAITKMATELGPIWNVQGRNIAQNAGRVIAFQKALGLTGEQMKAVGQRAEGMGKNISENLREMATYSYQLGKAFNLSAKQISRDVGDMMADMPHFAGVGIKAMTSLAVYSRKLGVEFKNLLGIVDKFDNFEDAANGAAKLSQSFGMNVDALKMMQSQDPGERVDMLRKSFYATGRTVENMTRQERALLASTSGVDIAIVDQVFSLKNQSLAYSDVQRKAAQTEKRQMTQAEAMKKLSSAIERMIKQPNIENQSFLDKFISGFKRGMVWSRDFWKLMMNVRSALWSTYWAGAAVGRAFMKSFPGIHQMFKGLADIFNRQKFKQMLGGVVEEFKKFFRAASTDPKTGFINLLNGLKVAFTRWFNLSGGAAGELLNGLKGFGKAFGGILAGIASQAMKGLTEIIKGIASFIRNPAGAVQAGSAAGGIVGFLSENFIDPMLKSLSEAWPALWDGVVDLFKSLFERLKQAFPVIKNYVINFAKEFWPYILAYLVGPTMIRGAVSGLTFGLAKAFLKGGVQATSRGVLALIGRKATSAIASTVQSSGTISTETGGHGPPAAVATETSAFFNGLKGMNATDIFKIGGILIVIAGALAVGGVLMAGSIKVMSMILSGIDQKDITASLETIGAMVVGMVGVSVAARLVKGIDWNDFMKSSVAAMTATGAIGLGGALLMRGMKSLLGGVTSVDILKSFEVITTMVLGVVAVAGAAFLINKMGGLSEITQGLAAVGIIVYGMVATLGVMSLLTHVAEPSKTIQIAKALESVSLVFIAAGAIAGIATVLGTIVSATGGIGGLVMAAGLTTIGVVVTSMAGTLVTLMRSIGSIQAGPEFIPKIQAFTGLMTAVTSMLGTMSTIVSAAAPGLSSILRRGSSFSDNLNSVNTLFQRMIGNHESGLIGLVTQLQNAITAMSINTNSLETMRAFSGLLSSVGEVIKGISPPPEFWTATSGFLDAFGDPGHSNSMGALSELMTSVIGRITTLISRIGEMAGNLRSSGFNENDIKALGAVGPILSAIAAMVQAIMPGPEFWRAATTARAGSSVLIGSGAGHGLGGTQTSSTSMDTGAIGILQHFFEGVLPRIGSLFGAIGTMIGPIRTALSGVNDNEIKSLAAIGPILASISTIVKSFTDGLEGAMAHGPQGSADVTQMNFIRNLSGYIGTLATEIPLLINNMYSMSRAMVLGNRSNHISSAETKGSLDNIKLMIDTMVQLPQILKGFEGEANTTMTPAGITTRVNLITTAIDALFSSGNINLFTEVFARVIGMNISRDMIAKVKNMVTVLMSINESFTQLQSIQTISTQAININEVGFVGNFRNTKLLMDDTKALLKGITLPDTHAIRRIVSSFQSIKGLFVGLGEIQAATAGSTFNAATFTTSLAGVTTAIQTIENNWSATGAFSADKLDTLTRNLATVRGATNRVIKEHLGNSIHTMVVEINKMTHEMETMETGHLQTRLHVLANDLGLGARDEFTIQNRNFTLNVNLDIIVDAEHLQLIMSRTPGAQIMVTLPAGTTVPPVRHP